MGKAYGQNPSSYYGRDLASVSLDIACFLIDQEAERRAREAADIQQDFENVRDGRGSPAPPDLSNVRYASRN